TPAYMAPERFRGTALSGTADVYSVGVMLFQMLTGRLPFGAPDADLVAIAMMHINRPAPALRELDSSIDAGLERVVTWALAKHEMARPTAGQLATGLCHVLGLDSRRPVSYLTPDPRAGETAPLPPLAIGRTTPAATPARAAGGVSTVQGHAATRSLTD